MRAVPSDMYCHKQDKIALEKLKAIPGFKLVLKKYMEIFQESFMEGLNMATKVQLSKDQMPEIYNILPPICEILGIEEPQFYLQMDPNPNAYTMGDTIISVTVTSGLINTMTQEELKAVIAHECGHIACHHVLYHSMASILLSAAANSFGFLTLPIELALTAWSRWSEFSADRAAAIVMEGSEHVENTMMKLAGGLNDITQKLNKELYMKQAEAYQDMIDNSKWNKLMHLLATIGNDHPLTAVRAYEINKWCKSEDFEKIIEFMK